MDRSPLNVLKEGFDLVKDHYLKFLELYLIFILIFVVVFVIVLIAAIILLAAFGITGSQHASGSSILAFAILFLLLLLIIILIVDPIYIGAYYAIALRATKGESVSVTAAINDAISKYWQLLWTIALEALIVILIDFVIFLPAMLAVIGYFSTTPSIGSLSAPNVSIGLFVQLFGIIIATALIYVVSYAVLSSLLFEAVPLVMLENTGGIKAIKRSFDIGKKHFWNILELLIGFGVLYLIFSFVPYIFIFVITAINPLSGNLLNFIVSLLIGTFLYAWLLALPIIYYKDNIA